MNVLRTRADRMKASLRRILSLFAVLSLLSQSASGQSAGERVAFTTISRYLAESGAENIEYRLKEIGFKSPVTDEHWRQLPAVRKVESAWHAAEASKRGSGQDMLAMLSRRLAQTYEAVSHEPALKSYLALPSPKVLRFSHKSASRPDLPPEVQKAIQVLCRYADGGAFGSAQDVIARYFNKSSEEAYQVLRRSSSTTEAFEKSWSELSPERQQTAFRQLADDVMATYSAAQNEPALKPFRSLLRPPAARVWPNASTGDNQGAANVTESNGLTPSQRYAQHIAKEAKPGAGGVVFHGVVTSDATVGKLSRLGYNSNSQSLVVQFDGGRIAEFGPIDLESAMVAYRIVSGAERTAFPGPPFILLGLTAPVEESECLPKQRVIRLAALRYKVLAHPDVTDSRLGWAMARLDAYPAHAEAMALEVETTGDAIGAERIRSLFRCPYAASWTINDVPITLGVKDARIVPRRTEATHGASERLRASAFLGMTVDGKSGAKCGLPERFEAELPLLLHSSEDFRVLNQFAAAFAIVRLAKEHNAVFEWPSYRPAGASLPSAMRISDRGVERTADYSVSEERRRDAHRSSSCWRAFEPLQP